jgi:hypothetical protein
LPVCYRDVAASQPTPCTIASMSLTNTVQEAVMGQSVPQQHPAVVLRSHYRQLRALVAILMIALVGLSTTVVMLAVDDEGTTTVQSAQQASTRTDGGPEESQVAASIASPPNVAQPDESKIAAAISKGVEPTTPDTSRPDESRVAASIAGD